MTVTLRPATAADEPFLRDLWIDAHPELAPMVDLQRRAQQVQYAEAWPTATDSLVLAGELPVGRCWTAPEGDAVRVLDLGILSAHRRRGYASAALLLLAATGAPVRLAVWSENAPAIALYEGLGFRVVLAARGYLHLERPALVGAR